MAKKEIRTETKKKKPWLDKETINSMPAGSYLIENGKLKKKKQPNK